MGKYLRLIRPAEWIKNVVVLAGPAFALHLFEIEALVVFVAFCLVASASYVLNDLADREADRAHPLKRSRPIASGEVRTGTATALAVFLAVAAFSLGYFLLPAAVAVRVVAILAAYFLLILAYSFSLKRHEKLDVIVIAVGFVLRAVAGAEAVDVHVSPWLIACTFTLCMLLGFGKRRCELAALTNRDDAGTHRSTLLRYTPELLNHLTSVSAGIAIMTFLLYTMDVSALAPHPPFKKEYLLYTLPLVAYGLFRYAMLIETGRFSGPTQIVLRDKTILATGVIWVFAAGAVIVFTKEQPAAAGPAHGPADVSTPAREVTGFPNEAEGQAGP